MNLLTKDEVLRTMQLTNCHLISDPLLGIAELFTDPKTDEDIPDFIGKTDSAVVMDLVREGSIESVSRHPTSDAGYQRFELARKQNADRGERQGAKRGSQGEEVRIMAFDAVISVIKRRQAKAQAQIRSDRQREADETARVIVEEYDSLLAEIEAARTNELAEGEILGDQGQSGG